LRKIGDVKWLITKGRSPEIFVENTA